MAGVVGDRRLVRVPGTMVPPQLTCPRCDSNNTKFCYYNNYNLSQPRYFCKSCRRYWTQGGTLRNVPVGGGTRKASKRSRSPSGSSPSVASCYSFPPPGVTHANPVTGVKPDTRSRNSAAGKVKMMDFLAVGDKVFLFCIPTVVGFICKLR
ncbi:hypothetical protein V6N13_075473 [Hibiscus sabdariffa]|uniref:Dof zinc finger protein n=1 Tax=Hibiscus sabdariffa TaxID=183260 RepID=A0ABR2UBL8_9ROSI